MKGSEIENFEPHDRQLAILQPYIPDYRVGLWSLVIDRLLESGIEARVFWGEAGGQMELGDHAESAVWAEQVKVAAVRIPFVRAKVVYRDVPKAWRGADVLWLTEMAVGNLNAWQRALAHKAYMTFGHAVSGTTRSGRVSDSLEGILNRSAFGVLTYTDRGRDHVIHRQRVIPGRASSFQNATDTSELRQRLADVSDDDQRQFRTAHSLPETAQISLFVGALAPYKRIDLLVEAAEMVFRACPNEYLVVTGDGPEAARLKNLAERTGRVRLLGRTPMADIAVPASLAYQLVNPGRVGLVAVDALAMRLPVLTTVSDEHAPEVDYLQPGVDVRFTSPTPVAFAEAWMTKQKHTVSTTPVPTIDEAAERIVAAVLRAFDVAEHQKGRRS